MYWKKDDGLRASVTSALFSQEDLSVLQLLAIGTCFSQIITLPLCYAPKLTHHTHSASQPAPDQPPPSLTLKPHTPYPAFDPLYLAPLRRHNQGKKSALSPGTGVGEGVCGGFSPLLCSPSSQSLHLFPCLARKRKRTPIRVTQPIGSES